MTAIEQGDSQRVNAHVQQQAIGPNPVAAKRILHVGEHTAVPHPIPGKIDRHQKVSPVGSLETRQFLQCLVEDELVDLCGLLREPLKTVPVCCR